MPQATLYHARSGNSLRAAIGREFAENDIALHLLDLTTGEQMQHSHLARNAAGKVPVYEEIADNGTQYLLTQSGAILKLLLNRYRPELIPAADSEGALIEASFLTAVSDIAVQNALLRYMDFDTRNTDYLQMRLLQAIKAAFKPVQQHPYLCGHALSLADLAHYPVIHMRRPLIEASEGFSHVIDWADHMLAVPQVSRAVEYAGLQLPA